ncbi:BT_3928 family protein [Mucilaginibacter paludis]|uniref:DoxX family protein n=1 Tax=Mucilaginibacter paludis DSM 18603 TaxID=714943 RepID=H1YGP7_9SPHI|nr:BT_3928 family protein [Mucilaginibacter paludis]EHQ25433.1 DoxX family protein [Mucilaginibacter paludis DSM 18603]
MSSTITNNTHTRNSWALWFCRIFVGVLFIFSGLIKANDPLGFSYKLEEYFEVFHTTFLNGLAVELAIFLCALEMFFGFALLIGAYSKKIAWGLLLLIVFFSFLTFYSAAFKVVQTCGCFGDAIVLTPWQSFSKDLVLFVLIIVIFINRDKIHPLFKNESAEKGIIIVATILSFGVGIYTYNFLPVIDFLPYKIGANIPDEMKTPPGAKADEYELTYHLKNKKTGETKVMTNAEYLKTAIWKDSNWQIMGEPESRLLKKGFSPKIVDLAISDAQGNDYTKELLSNPFYNVIIVAYNLDKTNAEAINKLNAITLDLAKNYNIRTVLLTSNSAQDADAFSKAHHLFSEVFYADAVPLKSMVRASPGVLLLKNGTIINKWHYHSVPTYDNIVKQYLNQE